jgi:hypothetical protein
MLHVDSNLLSATLVVEICFDIVNKRLVCFKSRELGKPSGKARMQYSL